MKRVENVFPPVPTHTSLISSGEENWVKEVEMV